MSSTESDEPDIAELVVAEEVVSVWDGVRTQATGRISALLLMVSGAVVLRRINA